MNENRCIDNYTAPEISDKDIYEAMEEISGYIDITPDDFRELYRHAFRHAHLKLSAPETGAGPAATPPRVTPVENEGVRSEKRLYLPVQASYWGKMRGGEKSPPRVGAAEVCWSWVGAFLGIGAVALCHFLLLQGTDLVMVIGSFGASAVLVYGAVKSPLAQPRNLIGGHVLSALVGVASYKLLCFNPCLAAAMAVATAIAVMHVTKTLHPPGGATALIAVIGSPQIHALGYLYVLVPAGFGAMVLLAVAVLVNNIPASRRYPEFWW